MSSRIYHVLHIEYIPPSHCSNIPLHSCIAKCFYPILRVNIRLLVLNLVHPCSLEVALFSILENRTITYYMPHEAEDVIREGAIGPYESNVKV